MNIRPIKNKKDYQNALERLELLFDAKKGSREGDELESLAILIEKYEDENFPLKNEIPEKQKQVKMKE